MSLFYDSALVGASGQGGGYEIERSLRFNSADSAYLSRTPASAGNRKTWTWAGWVKRSGVGAYQRLFSATTGASAFSGLVFTPGERLFYGDYTSGYTTLVEWIPVYRDLSAWFHVVFAYDTTAATASDRLKLYINGVQVTQLSATTYPALNYQSYINATNAHGIGGISVWGEYLSGYLADVHFIDGQALDPTSFGESDDNGVWQAKAYSGSYGTNGFHLPFSNNSSAAALGTDTSGNSNTWTVNNISVAAGAGNDSLVDSPTNYGTDTGAGGEVRGNYCTWNPLRNDQGATLSNGNLELSTAGASNRYGTYTTIGITTGKWYWEITAGSLSTDGYNIGIASSIKGLTDALGSTTESYIYINGGTKRNNNTTTSYGATYSAGDVIGVALDLDAGSLVFYKNGSSQGTAFTGIPTRDWFPTVADDATGSTSGSSFIANFGQRPFAYTAPSGYKALCTQNLPTPTIADGSTAFNTVTYLGNGSTQSINVGFAPSLIWGKERSPNADRHWWADAVRGKKTTGYYLLCSNNTQADTNNAPPDGVTAINSTGFELGQNTSNTDGGWSFEINQGSSSYVAWTWDAGSSTVTNNAGTISSQVRANPSAGFSIVTYTGTGATASVGHGLNALPQMIIVKRRDSTGNWAVYHRTQGANTYLFLSSTAAAASLSNYWQYTPSPGNPTSNWFGIIGGYEVNVSSATYVAYCFAAVPGYSSFGSYTGNGSADGPFVYTGFRPAFILRKNASSVVNWNIFDSKRSGYNVDNDSLQPQSASAEDDGASNAFCDLLSNGFKIRNTYTDGNANGQTYIYAAFAEHPFALARAR